MERPDYISERNWAIYEAHRAGTPIAALARAHAVTPVRVRQIIDVVAYRLVTPPAKPPGPPGWFAEPRRVPLRPISERAKAYRRTGVA